MDVTALLDRAVGAPEAHRDDLPSFGVVAETVRVGHADEFIIHRVADRFERLRNQGPNNVWIGPVGDDDEFAVVELVRTSAGTRGC